MTMKLNVCRSFLASATCVSLLSACDGRGVTPFQSSIYMSPETLAAKSRLNGQQTTSTNLDRNNFNTTVVSDTPVHDFAPNGPSAEHSESVALDTQLLAPIPAPTPAPAPSQAAAAPVAALPAPAAAPAEVKESATKPVEAAQSEPPVPMDGAKAKSMTELEPEQRKEGKRESLMGQIDSLMKTPVAQPVIKGLTIYGGPEGLGLDSLVQVGGQDRLVSVARTPIEFDKDGLITPLLVDMKSTEGEKVALGKSLYVLAFCADAPCVRAYLVFDVATEKSRVVTAFHLQFSAKNNKFEIVESNAKEVTKSFKEATAPMQKAEATGRPEVISI